MQSPQRLPVALGLPTGSPGPHLQQAFQAATEPVQLSTGVSYGPQAVPIVLQDGTDGSCGEKVHVSHHWEASQ